VRSQSCTNSLTSSSANRRSLTAPKRSKEIDIRRCKVRTVCWMVKNLKFQLPKGFPSMAALSWKIRTPSDNLPRSFVQMTGLISFRNTRNTLYLLLWFYVPGNVEGWDLESPRTPPALTSRMTAESSNFCRQKMMDAPTEHSDVCFVVRNDVFQSHRQWRRD
jgi:hypothetical protein